MKKVHATRAIVLLIITMLIWQYVEKRNDLQCYVMQQADRHKWVFQAGYATADEIREIVWNDAVTDFHGQLWRAKLDQVFQAIFMGGNRGAQVVAYLTHPPPAPSDLYCKGSIEWRIWYDPDIAVYRSYSGADIKSVHHVATTLKTLPQEELRHYSVAATEYSYKGNFYEGGSAGIHKARDAGVVSAREWLRGEIVPDYWSSWYAAWLEQWDELQAVDNE